MRHHAARQVPGGIGKGSTSTVAKTRADCKTSLSKTCLDDEKAKKADLLKHEQGHFDITNYMAEKALAGLKAKAKKLTLTATACDQEEASDAVLKVYEELPQMLKDWSKLKDKAQKITIPKPRTVRSESNKLPGRA